MGMLADADRPIETARNGAECGVGVTWRTLDDADQAVLVDWLNADDITGAAIARSLRDIGQHVSAWSVNRHRRTECYCWADFGETLYPDGRPDG